MSSKQNRQVGRQGQRESRNLRENEGGENVVGRSGGEEKGADLGLQARSLMYLGTCTAPTSFGTVANVRIPQYSGRTELYNSLGFSIHFNNGF